MPVRRSLIGRLTNALKSATMILKKIALAFGEIKIENGQFSDAKPLTGSLLSM